ncbi:MAG: hypothetical protein BWX64_01156 [Acidobacteria bacterium ADurb.Bin051]|nr:MAG: hypothetical protein BWX64_01156 [Acidobacteria bacterium ADurb.Bin051]
MDLGDRGGGERLGLDVGEEGERVASEIALDELQEAAVGERREAVEEAGELARHPLRQEVLAQREDLAELDVGGAERLEPPPELDREGELEVPVGDEVSADRVDEPERAVAEAEAAIGRQRAQIRLETAEEQAEEVAVGDEEAPGEAGSASLREDLELLGRQRGGGGGRGLTVGRRNRIVRHRFTQPILSEPFLAAAAATG